MVGGHPLLNGHEFEQVLGVGGGQRSLACCQGVHGVTKSRTQLSKRTTTSFESILVYPSDKSLGDIIRKLKGKSVSSLNSPSSS